MADDQELKQETTAYTAPAENGVYQFTSRLNDAFEQPKPHKAKRHSAVGWVLAGVLVLLIVGAAFCAFILQVSLSVHHDENGLSIELVRKRNAPPILRLEDAGWQKLQPDSPAVPNEQERYEWTGETLFCASPGTVPAALLFRAENGILCTGGLIMIEELLNKPYWIVDILPEQAPPERGRQYRRFEEYWLQEPRRSALRGRFADIADLVAVCPEFPLLHGAVLSHCHDICIVKPDHFLSFLRDH